MAQPHPVIYAFIDSQNLNLGVRACGWQLDFQKFRLYLTNKYGVRRAYLFIGQIPGNEAMYQRLQNMGYTLVLKPATQYIQNGKLEVKGNVDAELVLHCAAITFDDYDMAIIVSGDGDFHCLVEFLEERGKLMHILAPNGKYSGLLRRFYTYVVRIDQLKNSLAIKKTGNGGRSKP